MPERRKECRNEADEMRNTMPTLFPAKELQEHAPEGEKPKMRRRSRAAEHREPWMLETKLE
jgi:hypothetical protein